MKKATYTAAELVPILEIENKTAKQEVIDALRDRLTKLFEGDHFNDAEAFEILDQLEEEL